MGQEKKHIDNLFKDELGSYAETPPPMAWDALEKRLDKLPPKSAGWNPRPAISLAVLSAVLILSVSVARKYYLSTTGRQIAEISKTVAGSQPATAPIHEGAAAKASEAAPTQRTQTPANKNRETSANNYTANALQAGGQQPTGKIEGGDIKNNKPANTGNKKHANAHGAAKQAPLSVYRKIRPSQHHHTGESLASNADQPQLPQSREPENVTAKENNYNSNPDQVQSQTPQANNNAPGKQEGTPAEPKDPPAEKPKEDKKPQEQPKPKPKHLRNFARIEAGLKAGYESAFNTDGANKAVFSPYIQCNITNKISVMLQPAIKASTVQSRVIGAKQSYYRQNNDSVPVAPVMSPYPAFTADGVIYNLYFYYYQQSHDSIVKSHTFGGRYTEYELPLLFKYKVCKPLSVYAGVNIDYAQFVGIKENTFTAGNIVRYDTTTAVIQAGHAAPPPQLTTSQAITYTGTDVANYKNPYPAPATSMLRVGYMLGVSVTCKDRILFDALVQQTPTSPDVKGGYNLNSALSGTYFRFTLGYKIIK